MYREIYALENVVFCIAVYGPYKPIHATRNVQTQLKSTVIRGNWLFVKTLGFENYTVPIKLQLAGAGAVLISSE